MLRVLRWMKAAALKWVEVKEGVQEALTRRLRASLRGSVWLSGGCKSWYLDAEGGSSVLWPGLCLGYWWQTLWVRKADWNAVRAEQAQQARDKIQ